jgi:monoamine oxidase
MQTDIIIIGAGASGLAAAYELSLVNKKVLVLEAKDRIGGRIDSVKDERFKQIIETGAEFIHGNLPITLQLLDKAGIKHHSVGGKMWEVEKGQVKKTKNFFEGWDRLIKQLHTLEKDMPIKNFLDQYFPGEKDNQLKESVLQFVQGYDAADATRASSFALREEWENEEGKQERIDNGYLELINFLAQETKKRGNEIFLSRVVKTIRWEKGIAVVITTNNERFIASKILITISLGVWQAEGKPGCISFIPALTEKKDAARKMGFGAVIKINFQFGTQFWEEETNNRFDDAGFIFTDGEIPTWWTQNPKRNGIISGWLAGPGAFKLKDAAEEEVFEKAIHSLAYIFGNDESFIKEKLIAYYITNWTSDRFIRGAYSYATLNTSWARKILLQPIEQTLYFAGEALYTGSETGTVEGALANGIEVAREIIVQSV